jgi:hypothetical protein
MGQTLLTLVARLRAHVHVLLRRTTPVHLLRPAARSSRASATTVVHLHALHLCAHLLELKGARRRPAELLRAAMLLLLREPGLRICWAAGTGRALAEGRSAGTWPSFGAVALQRAVCLRMLEQRREAVGRAAVGAGEERHGGGAASGGSAGGMTFEELLCSRAKVCGSERAGAAAVGVAQRGVGKQGGGCCAVRCGVRRRVEPSGRSRWPARD